VERKGMGTIAEVHTGKQVNLLIKLNNAANA
jgi:hypothetical protein